MMHNDNEVDNVIEVSVELLYGSSTEKLSAAKQVASLLCGGDIDTLERVVGDKQLISAFARLLLADDSNAELSFIISKVILAVSMFEDFHEILSSNHRIGSTVLNVIEMELQRSSGSDGITFSTRQENFLFLCLSIVCNLATNIDTLRKMVKKRLVPLVVGCLQMRSSRAVIVSLKLLRLSSIFEETAVQVATNELPIIATLMRNLPNDDVQLDIITILFNISFHEDCLQLISNEPMLHSFLVDNCHERHLKQHIVGLMYHLSSIHDNRSKFFDAGISEFLIKSISKTTKKKTLDDALAGLLVNVSELFVVFACKSFHHLLFTCSLANNNPFHTKMTLHPLCAEQFVKNDVVGTILSTIHDSTDALNIQILLKVLRNISVWSRRLQCKIAQALASRQLKLLMDHVKDPKRYIDEAQQTSIYWEENIWNDHVSSLWDYLFQCKNDDIIVELVGLLSHLTVDDLPAVTQWHDLLLEEHKSDMLRFVKRVIDSSDGSGAPCSDDLKLEVIIWLGELCSDKECTIWFASMNIVDDLNSILTQSFVRRQDSEMSIEILYVYEQLLLHEETRLQVIGGDGVIDAILLCLEEGYSLRLAALKCLVILEDLDRETNGCLGSMGNYIRERRFALFGLALEEEEEENCIDDDFDKD